jgi:hypothetical protein
MGNLSDDFFNDCIQQFIKDFLRLSDFLAMAIVPGKKEDKKDFKINIKTTQDEPKGFSSKIYTISSEIYNKYIDSSLEYISKGNCIITITINFSLPDYIQAFLPVLLKFFKKEYETHYRISGKKLILDLIPPKHESFEKMGLIYQFLDFTVSFNSEYKYNHTCDVYDKYREKELAEFFMEEKFKKFKLFQFILSVEGHLSSNLNIDYLKKRECGLHTIGDVCMNLILFASPFFKNFEFEFDYDAKEFPYGIDGIDLNKEPWGNILYWSYLIFYFNEISISLTFPKYKNGIMMEFYRFASIDELLRKKNYEKRKDEKKRIAKKVISQFNSFSETTTSTEKQTTETIENMIIMGDIMKDEILIEKKENPEKFVEINEAIKDENDENFAISLLAKNLEESGIVTAVEKNADDQDKDITATNLQFMINGLSTKKKLDVHFDYGKEKNEKILSDPIEQKNFIDEWKLNLSKKLQVPIENIIITNLKEGSVDFDVFIKNHDNFDKLTEAIKEVSSTKGVKIKSINIQPLSGGIKLSPAMFDKRGNRKSGWGVGETRGGRPYLPPTKGYVGHGLKVMDKYDGGNNDWLDFNNNPNEWCVAYHATNLKFAESIMENGLKAGSRQLYERSDDINHPGKKVGKGVYFSPDICETEIYGSDCEGYKCVFMCRVNPKKIRIPKDCKNYWVVNGNSNEIRPYRLLIKKI